MKVYILFIYNGISWCVDGVYVRKKDVRFRIQYLNVNKYKIEEKKLIERINYLDYLNIKGDYK